MTQILVIEGTGLDTTEVASNEHYFQDGDYVEIRFYTQEPLTENEMYALQNSVETPGVVLTQPIVQDANIVFVNFRKVGSPLLIIATAMTETGAVVLGWQIIKDTETVPIVPIVIGGVILLGILYVCTNQKRSSTRELVRRR